MNNRKFTEIKRLRRENAKVFRDENGAYRMQVYPHSVHYYDEDTAAFEEKNSIYKKTTGGFKTTDGKRETEFFSNDNTPENVKIRFEDISLGMCFNGLTSSPERKRSRVRKGKFSIHSPIQNNIKEAYVKISNPSAVFEDVIDGVDIEYINESKELKENIVIKQRLESYEFNFILETKNLILKTDPEHHVLAFCDERSQSAQALFLIPAPFMTDASGERSDAVHYRVNKNYDGEYDFTVVADADWINSPDRLFPVKIDPTIIEMEPVYSKGAYIHTYSSSSANSDRSGRVGYDKYGNEYYSVISYELPDIGSASAIVGGNMSFYIGSGAGPVPQIGINIPGAQEATVSNTGNVYVTLNSSAISEWYNKTSYGAYVTVYPIEIGECEQDKDHDKYKCCDGVQPDVEDSENGKTTSTTIPNDGVQPDVEDSEIGKTTSTTIHEDGVYPEVGSEDNENTDTTNGVAAPVSGENEDTAPTTAHGVAPSTPGNDYEIDEPTDDPGVANPGNSSSEVEEPTYNSGKNSDIDGNNSSGNTGENFGDDCYDYYPSNTFSLRNINEPITSKTILIWNIKPKC